MNMYLCYKKLTIVCICGNISCTGVTAMKNIGGNIRKARERLGYSQAQLAYKLGISKQAVSNYENNRREPDLATIDTIAMVLKVPVTSIITEKYLNEYAEHEYSPSTLERMFDADEVRLIRAYRAADPIYRSIAIELLEGHPAEAEESIG